MVVSFITTKSTAIFLNTQLNAWYFISAFFKLVYFFTPSLEFGWISCFTNSDSSKTPSTCCSLSIFLISKWVNSGTIRRVLNAYPRISGLLPLFFIGSKSRELMPLPVSSFLKTSTPPSNGFKESNNAASLGNKSSKSSCRVMDGKYFSRTKWMKVWGVGESCYLAKCSFSLVV